MEALGQGESFGLKTAAYPYAGAMRLTDETCHKEAIFRFYVRRMAFERCRFDAPYKLMLKATRAAR
ncbi:hypothetical protein G5B47_21550 [Paenibacillus sp. 7124]|uniref:Uncharacterized protein n=1 Tax=Paenibacillus apii TaxID=1850370 RepID=A0A6M1PP15_9BACL|nr:hypothetical protein [Paenibacillus apii]NGM84990.1 hypothetical protein [Paenibacillus apii]NJJ38603.1 hypothetical protein [Paenibacillus apii]